MEGKAVYVFEICGKESACIFDGPEESQLNYSSNTHILEDIL